MHISDSLRRKMLYLLLRCVQVEMGWSEFFLVRRPLAETYHVKIGGEMPADQVEGSPSVALPYAPQNIPTHRVLQSVIPYYYFKMADDLNIYDEIEIEDMTFDKTLQIYHYPCPCGDRFEIGIADLRDGEEIAVCPSCSLMIKVIYDQVFNSPFTSVLAFPDSCVG